MIVTDKILKLICGAGNEDVKEIEKLSFIYSSAGFNMIDTSCKYETVCAVKNGIKKAGRIDNVSICVSIGLQDDIHVSKAVINKNKCKKCGLCVEVCERNAIFVECGNLCIDEKKCIGCSNCVKICNFNAIISEHKYKSALQMLLPLLGESIDCVEFHCTSCDEILILNSWNKIKSIYNGQLSICMNRSKLGDYKIIELLKEMTQNSNKVIIQADGNPMTGGINNYKSNLQTIAFAELIRNSGINSILILSGGTNAKTVEFAKICDIDINGVAIGSFARKLVKEYTNREDFWQNSNIQALAVNKAKELAQSLII